MEGCEEVGVLSGRGRRLVHTYSIGKAWSVVGQRSVGEGQRKRVTFSGTPCALQSFVLGRVFPWVDVG